MTFKKPKCKFNRAMKDRHLLYISALEPKIDPKDIGLITKGDFVMHFPDDVTILSSIQQRERDI